MSDANGQFQKNIRLWADKTKRDIDTVFRVVTLTVANEIITRTRVDTGRARGNWQLTTATPASGEIEKKGLAVPSDAATVGKDRFEDQSGKIAVAIDSSKASIYYLTNNVPYILLLEYGHSQQAANGMVRPTVERFEMIVESAANGVSS